MKGTVIEVLPANRFKVKVAEDHDVLAILCGKMRKMKIRVVLGDKVTVGVSPYDISRGRITYRER
jgi:translation initiation factor IF-1